MSLKQNVRTTGAVRRDLGISERQMDYLLRNNPGLEPRRVGNLRLWTDADVAAVRANLAARAAAKKAKPGGKKSAPE